MPASDNPHALRLYGSLLRHTDAATADRIANKIPLSKSADIGKKFAWAESICADLQREFDDSTVKKIRMDCACGPDEGKISSLKKLYTASVTMDDFAEKATAAHQGFSLQSENGCLLMIYPQCYCSCVKRIDKPLPEAWCYCTLGYAKRLFGSVFDRAVEVELLESVKTGGRRCVVRTTPE